ncbi:uncharacterized protein LOC121257812 isoform X2 [Juglans microcarpa x Juglans regia]|uniref:uncharacterized protein LOC121257812 isoform X2 n=1 Tax=Juglans microcarpa x Juglans regia TaxID=2249226 RepID=UPI001B7ED673|nr:uncharacterized protein LOC121257812 isoform X2 [Juglans microcarpa x Juglans regia]
MSTLRQQVSVRELVEEAKKRIVVLVICVVGLSYLMSLTSSSVWVNLPAAASLIIGLRYISLDFDMRRKAAAYNSNASSANTLSQKLPIEQPKIVDKSEWRSKVNSPVVEDAIVDFTRHLVSEWVTDLWYSKLTPDREGPEELLNIMTGVIGEISMRMKNINLIDLLTRDLINLVCIHLELFRANQAKIEKQHSGSLTNEHRDMELRRILANENKLHPALFSPEAEHKVLQHLMDGLISFAFKPEDVQCLFFRYMARELLAGAVMRPVLNLASPRFINERIEVLVLNMTKAKKGALTVEGASQSRSDESSRISSDHFSKFLDPSATGVELVQLKNDQSRTAANTSATDNANGNKDPLLSLDPRSIRSLNSLPFNFQKSDERGIQRNVSGGEWGDMLDQISRRKTQALAPEHFENMWTKGRDYRKKAGENRIIEQVPQGSSAGKSVKVDHSNEISKTKEKNTVTKVNHSESSTVHSVYTDRLPIGNSFLPTDRNISSRTSFISYEDDEQNNLMRLEEVDSGSSTSYTSEDEETGNVTGLDSPVTKVWDGRSIRNLAISLIHHPLENSEGLVGKKTGKGHIHYQRLARTQSGCKRSRRSSQKTHVWQEVERTSFLSGDGLDILNSAKGYANGEDSSDDYETENSGRVQSGAAASSSTPFSVPESHSLTVNSLHNTLSGASFLKLRCEVLGANIVRSGSKTFAVYSISVADVDNNSWSIKRRFRHFEELHRRLKEFQEYNLHLPPKHFLSTGLDVPVIQERCKLLDKYLKKLMQLPTISGSIEVWDFLSVDSQTYLFSNSFSIIETLSVDLDDKPSEKSKKLPNFLGPVTNNLSSRREHLGSESKEPAFCAKSNVMADRLRSNGKDTSPQNDAASPTYLGNPVKGRDDIALEEASESLLDAATDPTLPTEWVPPNLSVPILDLVDVIFQLQDGGWIRRKAFWVAKQILQLGMGDAFDDWLIEKVQLLRKGSVIASGIRRVEQILWPDGIFISKHPKRRPPPSTNQSQNSPHGQQPTVISSPKLTYEQQQEAVRRAKFVYELMIDNAPAAIVGLVGRKEYEQCAKDLYFFIQSSVCLKQLAFDLLELLLLSAFPELDYVFKQLQEEKHKFGEFKEN